MTYWLVRKKSGSYDEKYFNSIKSIKKGDILLFSDKSYITYFAICRTQLKASNKIGVEGWTEFKKPLFFPAKGAYVKTIVRMNNKAFLEEIKKEIENIILKDDFFISDMAVYDFMSLKNGKIKFSKGINLFIGENGSGKSQILKLLYSIVDANNIMILENEESLYEKHRIVAKSLTDVFRTKQLGNLVNKDKKESTVTIDFKSHQVSYKFMTNSKKEVTKHLENKVENKVSKKAIFIPAKEVLSFFEGFRILYEKKYLSFDKTYYNLCKALEEPLSKKDTELQDIIDKLENILKGKIEIIDGSFYLVSKDKDDKIKQYEISLVAEGLRKIGMLAYLLSNGALDTNSILFWDEPEANMHPKLIDDIVSFLVMLSNKGMQIFISTHSPYIIESFNNHLKKDKIKNLEIEDEEISTFEGLSPKNIRAYLLEEKNIVDILDSKLGLLDDKLLHHFNELNLLYDRMRDLEWDSDD